MLKDVKNKWDKLTEGWFGSIIYVILGFAIAIAVNTGLGMAFQTDTPVVVVFSDSMVPTLLRGDMIFVYGTHDVKVGDIIVFDSPSFNYPIIHRIYNMTDGKIRTKGDNNGYVDSWEIDISNIHGKAGPKVPLLGWVKISFVSAVNGFR